MRFRHHLSASSACGRSDQLEPRLHEERFAVRRNGGDKTGSNPTDRGRLGATRHRLITDRYSLPPACLLSDANTHDSKPIDDLLDSILPIAGRVGRPRRRPTKLHAGKAYDYRRCRQNGHRRGIKPRISRSGTEISQKLGRYRWVEHTFAWINRFRRLVTRHERRFDIQNAFTALACSLNCLKKTSETALKGALSIFPRAYLLPVARQNLPGH